MTLMGYANDANKDNAARQTPPRDIIHNLLETWHVPGVSVAVINGDQSWTEGFGLAELPLTPFTADTLSYSGSTTKAHVAALLALLIESGKYTDDRGQPLSWKTPISTLIRDDFVLQDEWATAHSTLEDALCHRTGLAKHNNAYLRYVRPDGFHGERRLITLREMVRSLRHLPMASEPRTTFCYSNLMYATLSHVVETLTGQWLGDALRAWLWQPLGMSSTYLSLQDALSSGSQVARGYIWDDKQKRAYTALPRMPTEEVSGSGAIITSAADMARWMRFWLREQHPLSAAGHRSVRRPHIVIGGEGGGGDPAPYDTPLMYAKGWQTSSYRGHRFWTHHGGMDAFGAQVTFFPGLDFGVAVMGNTAFTANAVAEMATWHMVDERLGVPLSERFDWMNKWQSAVRQISDNVRDGLDKIYPDRPAVPVPPSSLPPSSHAGLYHHPGYGYIYLEAVEASEMADTNLVPGAQLRAELPDNNFRVKCDFVHVSGDEWIMYVDLQDAPLALTMHDFAAVEFRIGAGEVAAMGIEWRARSDVEGWIWYEKMAVDGGGGGGAS
ncbi:hypothetical protein JDV02_008374 [Purpureocillium takamizusanense]|uniref:Beta-lactamase-related domain-containing protein n=1 Tax=Purpureocillium takamizusanense TaxID=2060973 RepID=A0A9Q8VEB9_9HYPO|nr:uncharacterized protein JDV02_008374 [Purpureocillium takamizusanense]UNI22488.1 hypothetical protein JDV02_008374 [Purpureocillium takamizusanense]